MYSLTIRVRRYIRICNV